MASIRKHPRPAKFNTSNIREIIRFHGLSPSKRLAQHFLLDQNITERIVRASGPMDGINVLEIGPGPGGLTAAILAAEPEGLFAVERDKRCIGALQDLIKRYPTLLKVIHADALVFDETTVITPPAKVIANLPYNIASSLLLKWIDMPRHYLSLTLMFQKEVADRLVATPGGRTYGRLSVITQWAFEVRRLFDVAPRAFLPPPKVMSTIIQLEPRQAPLAPANPAALKIVVRAAFGQRRKMLRSSLKSLGLDPIMLLESTDISPTARAEELDVSQFCALARSYERLSR